MLSLLWGSAPASAQETHYFRIGAAATAGSFFEIGGVIASGISKPADSPPCDQGGSCGVPGLVAVAQATRGSLDNLLMIASDQIESGIAQSDVASWAYTGTGIFAGEAPLRKLRAIATLFPERLHLVVRAESPIQTLDDLKGRRISLGQTGSGTLVDARIVLAASGLAEKELSPEYLRSGTAAANLSEGTLEGFFLIGGVPIPAIRALAGTTPIRLVPIADEVLSKMRAKYGPYDRAAIPAGTYPGVGVATQTVGFHALWVVSANASDDLIYAITRGCGTRPRSAFSMRMTRSGSRCGWRTRSTAFPYRSIREPNDTIARPGCPSRMTGSPCRPIDAGTSRKLRPFSGPSRSEQWMSLG